MSKKQGSLSPQEIKRLQGGEMIFDGYDNEEIAEILGVAPRTVQRWRQKLNNEDNLQTLVRKEGSGHPSLLTDKQKQQLKQIILKGAIVAGYSVERWTSRIIAHLIQKKFGITMAPRTVRSLLPTLGLSPQMLVVKSHKHSDEEVLHWATRTWTRLKKKRSDLIFP
jgi:transposase